jgi:hypothetical protein
MDIVYLTLIAALLALTLGLVKVCDSLVEKS